MEKHTGGMGVWHSVRAHEASIRASMRGRSRGGRRRALARKVGIPFLDMTQEIRVVGVPCTITRDDELYRATEDAKNLLPWQGHVDNLVDRFDARSWLDIIPEHDNESDDEEEDSLINFERYGALVEGLRMELPEPQHLTQVDLVLRQVTEKDEPVHGKKKGHKSKDESTAGTGEFSRVGFSYGDQDDAADTTATAQDDDDDESTIAAELLKALPDAETSIPEFEPAEKKKVDRLALHFFEIDDYSSTLFQDREERQLDTEKRRLELEELIDLSHGTKEERREKKLALRRARDRAADQRSRTDLREQRASEREIRQGFDSYRPGRGRDSPSYADYHDPEEERKKRSKRHRSKSPPPAAAPTKQFITSFTSDGVEAPEGQSKPTAGMEKSSGGAPSRSIEREDGEAPDEDGDQKDGADRGSASVSPAAVERKTGRRSRSRSPTRKHHRRRTVSPSPSPSPSRKGARGTWAKRKSEGAGDADGTRAVTRRISMAERLKARTRHAIREAHALDTEREELERRKKEQEQHEREIEADEMLRKWERKERERERRSRSIDRGRRSERDTRRETFMLAERSRSRSVSTSSSWSRYSKSPSRSPLPSPSRSYASSERRSSRSRSRSVSRNRGRGRRHHSARSRSRSRSYSRSPVRKRSRGHRERSRSSSRESWRRGRYGGRGRDRNRCSAYGRDRQERDTYRRSRSPPRYPRRREAGRYERNRDRPSASAAHRTTSRSAGAGRVTAAGSVIPAPPAGTKSTSALDKMIQDLAGEVGIEHVPEHLLKEAQRTKKAGGGLGASDTGAGGLSVKKTMKTMGKFMPASYGSDITRARLG